MQNDNPSFEALFEAHWERVYRLLYRVLGDAASAEELALDVFWQCYRTPPAVENDDALAGWLYRVALRRAYNAIRSDSRRAKYEQAAASALQPGSPARPEEETERRIDQERVRAVLARMKPRSAQLLALRYSGLSYKEIAAALELASGSVGALLARAEKEFESLYEE